MYYTAVARQRSGVRTGQAMADVDELMTWEPPSHDHLSDSCSRSGERWPTFVGKVESLRANKLRLRDFLPGCEAVLLKIYFSLFKPKFKPICVRLSK